MFVELGAVLRSLISTIRNLRMLLLDPPTSFMMHLQRGDETPYIQAIETSALSSSFIRRTPAQFNKPRSTHKMSTPLHVSVDILELAPRLTPDGKWSSITNAYIRRYYTVRLLKLGNEVVFAPKLIVPESLGSLALANGN
jgi:hypothetical protein